MKQQIKEEKTPVAAAVVPPPPLSALPGGFLKQLVRETEKETKQKEPEVKDEKAVSDIRVVWSNSRHVELLPSDSFLGFFFHPLQPSKLSDNLVQQFLLPDQTPPILEAEMALRSEQQLISTRQNILSPDPKNKQDTRQEVTPEPQRPKQQQQQQQQQQQDVKSERNKKTPQAEQKKAKTEEVKQQLGKKEVVKPIGKKEEVKPVEKKEEVKPVEKKEERQEPEGRQADTRITEHDRREVRVHVVAI